MIVKLSRLENPFLKYAPLFILIFILSLNPSCNKSPYPQGEGLYNFYCANCHMEDGTGLKKLIPGLNDKGFLEKHRLDLPCWIREGMEGPIQVNGIDYNFKMEGFPNLEPAEINNIVNYILTSFGNNLNPISPMEIQGELAKCAN